MNSGLSDDRNATESTALRTMYGGIQKHRANDNGGNGFANRNVMTYCGFHVIAFRNGEATH
jgi:hypothetical protein